MKRSTLIGVSALLISCLCIAIPVAHAVQNISGTVVDEGSSQQVQGIQVSILDAVNSEPVATSTTGSSGFYNSGNIPAGNYRVRFFDPGVLPGYLYVPKFYGAPVNEGGKGGDNFCAGIVVTVPPDGTVIADEGMTLIKVEPVLVAPFNATIFGRVTDASTGLPIQGITVGALDVLNAVKLGKEGPIFTDVNGEYEIGVGRGDTAKIRFSDSTGTFFPEFFGAADRDEFCSGATITLVDGGQFQADAALERVPPEQLTQNLTDMVNSLNIPTNVSAMLGTPLIRAVNLLTDGNPNNDAGVCGQLTSFITRVNIQENNGQLSAAEANDLRQSANNIQAALGCG